MAAVPIRYATTATRDAYLCTKISAPGFARSVRARQLQRRVPSSRMLLEMAEQGEADLKKFMSEEGGGSRPPGSRLGKFERAPLSFDPSGTSRLTLHPR